MRRECDGGIAAVIGPLAGGGRDGAVGGGTSRPRAARMLQASLRAMSHRGDHPSWLTFDERGETLGTGEGTHPETPGRSGGGVLIGAVSPRRVGQGSPARPEVVRCALGTLAMVTTGRLVNAPSIERSLLDSGAVLQAGSHAELLLHLVARSGQRTLVNKLVDALMQAAGGYALLLVAGRTTVAVRDPLGLRPMCLAQRGGAVLLASESRALEQADAQEVREVQPGEMLIHDEDGLTSLFPFARREPRPCVREVVALARPDSDVAGRSAYEVRYAIGERLAARHPAAADVVLPLIAGSEPAAAGYADRLGLRLAPALVDEPPGGPPVVDGQLLPATLAPVTPLVRARRVVVVGGSVGPEVPWRPAIRALQRSGARAVHARLAAPPTFHPCHYGVRLMPDALAPAVTRSAEETREQVGADTFEWLELHDLQEVVTSPGENFCDGCYSGHHPLVHEDLEGPPQLPLFGAP